MSKSSRVAAGLSVAGVALLPLLAAACSSAPEVAEPEPQQEEVGTTQSELSLQPVKCDRLTFPVALAAGQAASYNVVGWLCGRGSIDHNTIQLLVHGSTYSHYYWDLPYKSAQYSYVHAATLAGFATLNIDRIGIGESDHPSPFDVTIESNAYVLHQIIQKLRSNTLVTPTFGRVRGKSVMSVGHSLGAAISNVEAALYHDVDGVIVTGFLNNFGPGQAEIGAHFWPANMDPKFAGRNIPDGYLTTTPGSRGESFFYYGPATDPGALAADEATKETCTLGEISGTNTGPLNATALIDVPVLSVVGDYDTLFCSAPSCTESGTSAREPQFYSPASRVKVVTIPSSGHCLNMQKQAPVWYAIAAAWSALNVGIDTRFPAPIGGN